MRILRTTLAVALLATLAAGAGCGEKAKQDETSAAERQILQELAALRDDVDEVKDALAEIQAQNAAQNAARPGAPTAAAPRRPTRSRVPVQTAGYPFLGKKDAAVTIVEFTDYQCPFCRRHFASTMPQIKADYVDTGKVRYVLVDNPIPSHRYAAQAAEAAHCAGDQGHYWEMHDQLFNNQHMIRPDAFAGFAKAVGLNEADFSACMSANKHAPQIQAGGRMAASAGATGTPSFVLGKTAPDGSVSGELVVGAKSFALFKDRLDHLLAN
jgi:protein-disulfide isomerase